MSDIVVRAEAGCEPLADRWAKLTLGFWRRLYNAREGRLLRRIAEFRHEECVANTGYGHTGWMPKVRDLLVGLGLRAAWTDTQFAVNVGHGAWKDWVAELVDGASNTARAARLTELPSAQDYVHTKH